MKSKIEKRAWEISLVAFISAIVVVMIVPLSPWAMDILISLNLGISVLIFCLALLKSNPLQFSAFPTVLLIATLYRLALNISSTRLILTRADAGQIIGGFGGFVMGGDIIVGAVIFGIILMVLFLVITKGAERVAEVAARFTLDALPGMQLAIETDLRSKSISPRELTLRRQELEERSMYYGSLDGAMKFVRGDAVAALVITAINITGGTLVGVLRKGLSVEEALNLYGRLTVGDGLATMIPALLISTAAGLLVTRVAQGQSQRGLAEQIGGQLVSEPKALIAAAVMMVLLAVLPGLPAWPFILAGAVLFATVVLSLNLRSKRDKLQKTDGLDNGTGELGLDEIQHLLDEVAATHPVLVREAVWERLPLPYLADIISECKGDGMDERYLPQLLEALAREEIVRDIDELLIRVRKRISASITDALGAQKENLRAATLELETEQLFRTNIVKTISGKRLVLPPKLFEEFVELVRGVASEQGSLVLLTEPQLRRPLQRLLSAALPHVFVVGYGELLSDVNLDVRAELSLQ